MALNIKGDAAHLCGSHNIGVTYPSAGFINTTVKEIGRASCRERVEISVVAVSIKKKKKNTTIT